MPTILFDGVAYGMLLFVLACGLSVTLGLMNFVNLAHGAFAMVGGYDEFSDRSYATYPGGTSRQRWLRDLLRSAMEAEGFAVIPNEWWHFDYKDWPTYPILDVPFGALPARPTPP